ncbi:MAG: cobalamin-binding protein, partial [Spirochaetes bacterium]
MADFEAMANSVIAGQVDKVSELVKKAVDEGTKP